MDDWRGFYLWFTVCFHALYLCFLFFFHSISNQALAGHQSGLLVLSLFMPRRFRCGRLQPHALRRVADSTLVFKGRSGQDDFTSKFPASERPRDKVEKPVEVASHLSPSNKIFVLVVVLPLVVQLLLLFFSSPLRWSASSAANLNAPHLESASA